MADATCDPSKIPQPQEKINPQLAMVPASCLAHSNSIINGGSEQAAELGRKLVEALQSSLHGCGITSITYQNFSIVKACLQQNQIPAAAINELERSVNLRYYDNLQCVGLIYALEAATGGTIQNQKLNAEDHWREISGYQQIQANDSQNLQLGDILVWHNQLGGHMAMIVDIRRDNDNVIRAIKTVQADGLTGEIKYEEMAVTANGLSGSERAQYYGTLLGWQRRGS